MLSLPKRSENVQSLPATTTTVSADLGFVSRNSSGLSSSQDIAAQLIAAKEQDLTVERQRANKALRAIEDMRNKMRSALGALAFAEEAHQQDHRKRRELEAKVEEQALELAALRNGGGREGGSDREGETEPARSLDVRDTLAQLEVRELRSRLASEERQQALLRQDRERQNQVLENAIRQLKRQADTDQEMLQEKLAQAGHASAQNYITRTAQAEELKTCRAEIRLLKARLAQKELQLAQAQRTQWMGGREASPGQALQSSTHSQRNLNDNRRQPASAQARASSLERPTASRSMRPSKSPSRPAFQASPSTGTFQLEATQPEATSSPTAAPPSYEELQHALHEVFLAQQARASRPNPRNPDASRETGRSLYSTASRGAGMRSLYSTPQAGPHPSRQGGMEQGYLDYATTEQGHKDSGNRGYAGNTRGYESAPASEQRGMHGRSKYQLGGGVDVGMATWHAAPVQGMQYYDPQTPQWNQAQAMHMDTHPLQSGLLSAQMWA